MGVWFALDMMLLVAGVIAVALSQLWRTPNVLMNMVLSNGDLTGLYIMSYGPYYPLKHHRH